MGALDSKEDAVVVWKTPFHKLPDYKKIIRETLWKAFYL